MRSNPIAKYGVAIALCLLVVTLAMSLATAQTVPGVDVLPVVPTDVTIELVIGGQ